MENSTITNRPTWGEEMKKDLAKIVGKLVNEWCQNETSLEECIESSEKVLEYNSNDNGYELAKEFEDEGFSPDSELVEILDCVSYEKSKVQEAFIKKWVADNNLKLELSIGQRVVANFVRKGQFECEIVKLYPETMQYGLWYESIGYEKGKGHAIVNFESIVSII